MSAILRPILALSLILGLLVAHPASPTSAATTTPTTVSDLNAAIQQKAADIQKLTQETQVIQTQLDQTSAAANTLKNAVSQLNLSSQKTQTDIAVTKDKVSATQLTLQQIGDQISADQATLASQDAALSLSIRMIDQEESQSLVDIMLTSPSLSTFFDDVYAREQFQSGLKANIDAVAATQADLQQKQTATEQNKQQLVALSTDLSNKKQAIDAIAQTKAQLLSQTKNQEAAYQAQLAQKKAQAAQFQQDLFNFESSLKLAVDPNSYPSAQPSVLSWPLTHIYVTQKFGATVDSKRLYVSGTHNGVDFAAPVGTPVMAVLDGVVKGVGNTDTYQKCLSYGKWVFIQHPNGLSTIYGHLSVQLVKVGDTVTTGQLIGYSGETGYVTGPHLHLGLFATQGARIEQYTSSIGCKGVSIPIADPKAYLDPLAYLPALAASQIGN